MNDPLIRRLPPMANEWTLGLASGKALDEDAVARFVGALEGDGSDALAEVMAVVVAAIETANSNFFRFEIETAVDDSEPTVLRLSPMLDSDHSGLGLTREQSTRKLVALVVLSVEGAGVKLQLVGQDKSTDAEAGSIVMFPAYCNLRVIGPEAAEVVVAACHAFGPAFR